MKIAAVLITIFSAVLLLAGSWLILRPDAAVRRLPELSEDLTPDQARWNARSIGGLCLFFGWAGLHLVFVEGLRPFEPGDTGAVP